MTKYGKGAVALGMGLVVLFAVSGRRIGELFGYMRAGADTTVERLVDNVPNAVHDMKLEHELQTARQELIDHKVQLNLSAHAITELREDVTKLEESTARRKRLLAEAYPVLNAATDGGIPLVKFANADFTLVEFQHEVDGLLLQQQREIALLEIKRASLARLAKNSESGEQVLSEMHQALAAAEQEASVLKSRREQSAMESKTLDLITTVASRKDSAGGAVNESLTRLRTDVTEAEARNEARRTLAPDSDRSTNRLSRQWSRLEELKSIHDEHTPRS